MIMKQHKNNKGYSMVELIMVIAIIGILTAASLVTWRSVDSAKYKRSVSTFESEVSTLRKATMSQDSRMALRLYYNTADETYYIERGYWGTAESGGSYNAYHRPEDAGTAGTYTLADASYYDYSGTTNPVKVMNRGWIEYWADTNGDGILEEQSIPEVDAEANPNATGGVVIKFNKSDGSIAKNEGEYRFYRANGDLITTVHLVKNTGLYFETY